MKMTTIKVLLQNHNSNYSDQRKNALHFTRNTIFFMLFFVMLIGCSSSDPVQDDLLSYSNDYLLPIENEKTEILNAYNNVLGDSNASDEDINAVLSEIIPEYRSWIEKLEAIRPETDTVRELHEIYISASNKQFNAFVQIQAAIEQSDSNLVSEANVKLDEARSEIREYENKLASLDKEYNIVREK